MTDWLSAIKTRRFASGGRPIVVGPWRSELGFECLYWLPWLAAWRTKHRIAKERVIVVARGGSGAWYDAAHAVDLYDYVPPAKVRKAMLADQQATGSIKQYGVSGWERQCLGLMVSDLGIRRYHWLHPSVMYRELTPWWSGTMSHAGLLKRLEFFAPIPTPAAPLTLSLPERFVAVRFYHRHTWPMTEELRDWTTDLVERLAKRMSVVTLDCGMYADDHADFPLRGDNIHSLIGHITPQNNLAVQSAVLAKAQAFVGTYGGTMQLAVRLRKPSIGFYSTFAGTAYAHKQLTEWLAVQQGTPCFIARPGDARMVMEMVQ